MHELRRRCNDSLPATTVLPPLQSSRPEPLDPSSRSISRSAWPQPRPTSVHPELRHRHPATRSKEVVLGAGGDDPDVLGEVLGDGVVQEGEADEEDRVCDQYEISDRGLD